MVYVTVEFPIICKLLCFVPIQICMRLRLFLLCFRIILTFFFSFSYFVLHCLFMRLCFCIFAFSFSVNSVSFQQIYVSVLQEKRKRCKLSGGEHRNLSINKSLFEWFANFFDKMSKSTLFYIDSRFLSFVMLYFLSVLYLISICTVIYFKTDKTKCSNVGQQSLMIWSYVYCFKFGFVWTNIAARPPSMSFNTCCITLYRRSWWNYFLHISTA